MRLAGGHRRAPAHPDERAESTYPLLMGRDPRFATAHLLERVAFVVP